MSYVFTDDVIMDHKKDPIHEGTSTSTAFLGLGTTLLLSKLSMDEVVRWGKLHKVVFDDLRCGVVDLKKALLTLSSMGKVDILVTADPSLASWALDRGIVSSLMCYPRYSLPKNRPGLKPWDTLVSELERQAIDDIYVEEE